MISMNKTNPGVALVTGASSGIGRATAIALQSAGFRVFGTSRRAAKNSDGLTMLACDVTDDASVAKLVDDVLAETGRIDLLVNNAGMGLFGGAEESSIAQAQALFEVNAFGVLRVTNAVLPIMRRQGKGRIVNLSSVQGFIPAPYFALYASTKHAIEGYSESLDHELRPFGIRVALVEPAYTRTSFEDNLAKPDQLLDIYDAARAGVNAVVRKAMEKGDSPELVAKTVLAAATDAFRRGAMRREKWRARSVSCAVSSPHPHSTRACVSRTGCRPDDTDDSVKIGIIGLRNVGATLRQPKPDAIALENARRLLVLGKRYVMLQCERVGATSFPTRKQSVCATPADWSVSLKLPGMGFGIRWGQGVMLYTLVMMVCLTDVPQTCEKREQIVDGLAMHPGTAFMQAQPLVAQWIETHPGYFVQRWRVLPGRGS